MFFVGCENAWVDEEAYLYNPRFPGSRIETFEAVQKIALCSIISRYLPRHPLLIIFPNSFRQETAQHP
jgi:hypothetical protein